MARCKGSTKAGARCRRVARDGDELCAQHAGDTKPRRGARPIGRPSRLEESPDRIIPAARLAYLRSAGIDAAVASSLNVPKQTFADWRRRGRVDIADGEDTVYARLERELDDARGELIGELSGHHLANALKKGDPHQLASILRRLDPDQFTDPERRKGNGGDGAGTAAANAAGGPPIQVLHVSFGDDVQEQITAIISGED